MTMQALRTVFCCLGLGLLCTAAAVPAQKGHKFYVDKFSGDIIATASAPFTIIDHTIIEFEGKLVPVPGDSTKTEVDFVLQNDLKDLHWTYAKFREEALGPRMDKLEALMFAEGKTVEECQEHRINVTKAIERLEHEKIRAVRGKSEKPLGSSFIIVMRNVNGTEIPFMQGLKETLKIEER